MGQKDRCLVCGWYGHPSIAGPLQSISIPAALRASNRPLRALRAKYKYTNRKCHDIWENGGFRIQIYSRPGTGKIAAGKKVWRILGQREPGQSHIVARDCKLYSFRVNLREWGMTILKVSIALSVQIINIGLRIR